MWQPTPLFLPGESNGQRSLAGCDPWACKESDTTEHAHTQEEIIGEEEAVRREFLLAPSSGQLVAQSKGRLPSWCWDL